jgi:hypothetical protein
VQAAIKLLMIRPAAFAYNTQTAGSNKFQRTGNISHQVVHELALNEFDAAVNKLRQSGIDVDVIEDSTKPLKPDAIFPNNWLSVHENSIVLYPLYAPNRRLERRDGIIRQLLKENPDKKLIDLTNYEAEEKFLEGTGSLVLDHDNKIAYACISERTHPDLVMTWCELMNYSPIMFHALLDGHAVYHTNVIMSIGNNIAVCCTEAIDSIEERDIVTKSLKQYHNVIEISVTQMKLFAGNILLVRNAENKFYWILSQTALDALTNSQRNILEQDGELLPIELHTVETYGGGSARCMLAEIKQQ